jgi:diaminohydroxyphosphoribosylaminopyrimidine deaminase / 5-amino-6-(5-phosphoribosylamino)uracil reductase
MFTAADHAFMARALALTAKGRNTATPNPSVGCVIVKGGRVIGEGWHAIAGGPHAEAAALAACTESPEGAIAYVTLEPCNHHGRTPPCSEALVAARVARVVAAIEDPDPRNKGEGLKRLAAAGIRVETGLMQAEAREAHRGFLARVARGRPWMRLKVAATFDGRTALANGKSQWITGEAARRDVHRLRAESCAVLTGIGTVQRDNPRLTVRDVPCYRQPLKALIDSRLDLAPGAALLEGGGLLVITVSDDVAKRRALEALGARVAVVAKQGAKTDLAAAAQALAAAGLNDVLVETGARLNGSLIRAGVVDELIVYIAPSLFGDTGMGLFALPELAAVDDRIRLAFREVRQVGEDLRITARLA